MRYQKWLIGGGAVLMIAMMAFLYHGAFPIEADWSNLNESVRDYYNRGYSVERSPDIKRHDSVTLGKETYILLEIDGELGRVLLSKGLTGRYRIESLGYGSGDFREGVVEYGPHQYLLFAGRNTGLEIASMEFTMGGDRYRLNIPAKPLFFVYTEIDGDAEFNHLNLDTVKLYNAKDEDITQRVDWNGGNGI